MLRVDEYPNDLYFIKFYPSNLYDHPNKYKIRVGNINELSRLIATCIKLAKIILKKNPAASFGFYGQWDEKDVEVCDKKNINSSQRFRLYLKAVLRKVNDEKYSFVQLEELNLMIIISKENYSEELVQLFVRDLLGIYKNDISSFTVPSIKELKQSKETLHY
jgi:glycosyltransferase involved in cell wall biosynthesis